MGRIGFVGRRAEQESLRAWLGEARDGTAARFVVCTGEPGIGKTRSAEELSRFASEHGLQVAWGLGDDMAGAPPYWIWRQVLRALDCERVLDEHAAVADDDAARFRLFDAIAAELRAVADRQATLIVLDDIHWADESSLLLLRHVVRGLRAERLMLLVNCRELIGRPGEILIGLTRTPAARTLALGGLDVSGVLDALRALTSTPVDDAVAASAHEVTGGNPLFLIELAGQVGRRDFDRVPVTPSVREAIAVRVAVRSEDCGELLRAASVIGPQFTAELAAEVAGQGRAQSGRALAEALNAGLIDLTEGGYRFAHPLIREALLADVSPDDRVRAHRRTAEAMVREGAATRDADLFIAAHHWLESADPDADADAAEWCERAGAAAMLQHGYEDAVRWYRDALRCGGTALSSERRCELLLAISRAAARYGDLSACLGACSEAVELATGMQRADLLAQAALTLDPGPGRVGFSLAIRRWCQQALGALDDQQPALRARITARFAATYIYLPESAAARTASADALRLAEESGDSTAIADACRARLAIAAAPADLAERTALAERLAAVAGRLGDPPLGLAACLARIDVAFEHGDLAEVEARLDHAAVAAARVGGPVARYLVLHSRAALAQARAQFADARAAIAEAFAAMAAGDIAARFHTRAAVLSVIGRHVGQDQESLDAAGYADAPPGIKEGPGVIVTVSHAAALASAGRLADAAAVYRSAGPATGWQIPPHVAMLVPALGVAAAAALGELADLEFFASALEPARGHHVVSGIGAITYGGPVELWLGVAARHLGAVDAAIELLTDAAQRCAANGASGYLVEAQTELVAALRSRGDAADAAAASDLAARALASARALGMAPFVTRLMAMSGRRTRTEAEPLTARQLEVARLVARGLSNREIAEALTLSERTAENHVQHIMLKLGLPNRSGIAVWVTKRDP